MYAAFYLFISHENFILNIFCVTLETDTYIIVVMNTYLLVAYVNYNFFHSFKFFEKIFIYCT